MPKVGFSLTRVELTPRVVNRPDESSRRTVMQSNPGAVVARRYTSRGRWTVSALLLAATLLVPACAAAQEKPAPEWDTTEARGQTRDIDFDTSEGTWMSLDVSPDGKWIVFDLLGHVYRMPATGGKAECLTQDSGIALNMTPRFSPDGKTIAFISDRKGQNNLWLMDADGKNPRAVATDKTLRALSPVWSPDGNYIIVQRQGTRRGGSPFAWSLVMYHKDGGSGVVLVSDDKGPSWH